MKSDLPGQAKLDLLRDFDRLFGLDLDRVPANYQVPAAVLTSLEQRSALREQADYPTADSLRSEVAGPGLYGGRRRVGDQNPSQDAAGAAGGSLAGSLVVPGS